MNENSQKIPDIRVDRRRHKQFKFFVLIKCVHVLRCETHRYIRFTCSVHVYFTPSATESMEIVTENRCVRYQVIGTKVCTMYEYIFIKWFGFFCVNVVYDIVIITNDGNAMQQLHITIMSVVVESRVWLFYACKLGKLMVMYWYWYSLVKVYRTQTNHISSRRCLGRRSNKESVEKMLLQSTLLFRMQMHYLHLYFTFDYDNQFDTE